MSEPIVYLNGELVPASRARLQIYDCGVVLGATVTEMTRTFRGSLFRLDDHIDRLLRSLKYVRIDPGLTRSEWSDWSRKVADFNHKLLPAGSEIGLIHFVTAGEVGMYAGGTGQTPSSTPTACIHTFPLPFSAWARKLREGTHLVTPATRHVPPQCYDPKMKYRSRMHYFLADQEARLVDPDASALLLDLDGNATETSGANFLMVERGTIVSPTLRNTLGGVSRMTVQELAHELGIPFLERDITVHSLLNADEAMLSSTPFCLMPVTRINSVAVGDGKPGPMFRSLMDAWSRRVGVNIAEQILGAAGP